MPCWKQRGKERTSAKHILTFCLLLITVRGENKLAANIVPGETMVSSSVINALLEEVFAKKNSITEESEFYTECERILEDTQKNSDLTTDEKIIYQLKAKMCRINYQNKVAFTDCATWGRTFWGPSSEQPCTWKYYKDKFNWKWT